MDEPCKVLVVDDHRDGADSVVMLIQAWGHDAMAAYTAEQALAMAYSYQPDVVLMDLGMPGKDGFQLGKEIEALSPGCRIVALTGFTQADMVRRSQQAGFVDYLVKPTDPQALNAVVEEHCSEAKKDCPG